ncbi:MAG: shikimate kinase [Desulfosalsimonadaceae bacterium]
MIQRNDNLILVGMPGAGKSTVGVILAKLTSRDFVDTDLLIQTSQKRTLQDIVDTDGYAALRKIEEEVLTGLFVENHVIATGGSAVYSDPAMKHMRSLGVVIFLDTDLPTLATRVHNFRTRGLAKKPDQDFADLYNERSGLYAKYADTTIRCSGLTHEEVCAKIIEQTGIQS